MIVRLQALTQTCTDACSLIVYVAQSMYGLRSIHACLFDGFNVSQ